MLCCGKHLWRQQTAPPPSLFQRAVQVQVAAASLSGLAGAQAVVWVLPAALLGQVQLGMLVQRLWALLLVLLSRPAAAVLPQATQATSFPHAPPVLSGTAHERTARIPLALDHHTQCPPAK